MPAYKPKIPVAAEPRFGDHFDPWHAVGQGHQRAESRLPIVTGWRQSRSTALSHQLKARGAGDKKFFDAAKRKSENENVTTGVLAPAINQSTAKSDGMDVLMANYIEPKPAEPKPEEEKLAMEKATRDKAKPAENTVRKRGIFDGLVIYINGSTYPLISDHKLKQLLAENGAKISLHLGRRQVTHVILGKPSGTPGEGAGGGLAGSKLDKEIKRVGGCGVKYIGVEWVLESIKAGKRQAEAPFVTLKIAAKGQRSVYGMLKKHDSSSGSRPA